MPEQPTPDELRPQCMSLRTLHLLDKGRVDQAFSLAMRRMVEDVQDRPGEAGKRVVTLEVELTPNTDNPQAALDDVEVRFVVKAKSPAASSALYKMAPTPDNRMAFNPLSPFDSRQQSLQFPSPPPAESRTDLEEDPE